MEQKTLKRPRFADRLEPVAMRLPAGKNLGVMLAVTLAANGDMFVLHQPFGPPGVKLPDAATLLPDVVHLNSNGDFINAWGGKGYLPPIDGIDQWPDGREGIECDAEGNIWIFGFLPGDDAVLKFSPQGKLLFQLGQRGKPGTDTDTKYLKGPTSCYHDVVGREAFITDGYGNHRVIAFNSDTGAFTRMWGAYGKPPASLTPDEGFGTPVHKIIRGPNGHLYVCDRKKNRVQEFELVPGSVRFIREVEVAPGTMLYGAAWDIAFTPDNKYLLVSDGTSNRIWTVDADRFEVIGWANAFPDPEGELNLPQLFAVVHRFAMEPNGDLLLASTTRGLQRLKFLGVR